MATFDLIPSDYRRQLWLRASAIRLGLMMTVMLLACVAGYVGLSVAVERTHAEITLLERQQEISVQQRDHLLRTNETAQELGGQLRLLAGLRSGTAAPAMFVAIDNAMLTQDVWFTDWEFLRAGTIVDNKTHPRKPDYFIVAAPNERSDEAWLIETRMRIVGQARDHSALSTFVRRLYSQPEIEDVRILNTTLASQKNYVDFELRVTVDNGELGT